MYRRDIKRYLGRIINGNCAEVLSEIKSNSVDLIVTSPPYDDLRDYKKMRFGTLTILKK